VGRKGGATRGIDGRGGKGGFPQGLFHGKEMKRGEGIRSHLPSLPPFIWGDEEKKRSCAVRGQNALIKEERKKTLQSSLLLLGRGGGE